MDRTLGHFGDFRLQKGGPFFSAGCSIGAAGRCVCAGSAGRVRERCGLRDFCVIAL